MKLKLIVLFTGVLFLHTHIFGQSGTDPVQVAKAEFKAKQVLPPAPEAAELGKYGNVPISLFTGTPNISIPLFDLTGVQVSLPISLSYHAGGFKPEDQSTWVGSGWSLNAGGVITRGVIGNPDEQNNYFGQTDILNPPNSTDLFPYFDYLKDLNDGVKEAQPDMYYYNFAGHSGKFLLRPDHSIMKKEKDGLQISKCTSCVGDAFTIVDEQGYTYIFEATETTQMIPSDAGPSLPWYTFISSWYLTAMYPPTGSETITFDYYNTGYQSANQWAKDNQSFSASYLYSSGTSCGDLIPSGSFSNTAPPATSIQRQYLKKVTLKKSGVTIAYVDVNSAAGTRLDAFSSEDRQLQQLKLYSSLNGSNSLVKQYDLTQGYFSNSSNPLFKNRLRLDAVQEKGTDGTTASKPPYQFIYNTDINMPERYTNSIDHWGFYNNSGNTSLVPNVSINGGMYYGVTNVGGGANREPSLEGSLYSTLTKIQYPTGGYTTFEYELNKAENDRPVGGLRIHEMIDNSFTGKPAIVKDYAYTYDNGTSSGKAGVPEYAVSGTYHHYQEPQPPGPDQCGKHAYTNNTITVASSSIFGLGSIQGSHIGYEQVTEIQKDLATGQALGKTVNKYTTFFNDHDDDLKNGALIEQDMYDNGGKLLQSSNNTYTYSNTDNLSAYMSKPAQAQTNRIMYCKTSATPPTYLNYADFDAVDPTCVTFRMIGQKSVLVDYGINQQRKLLTTQVTKIYDQKSDSYLTSTKEFIYGNSDINSPTQIKETTNGELLYTTIKYAGDYTIPGSTTGIADNIKNLNLKNMKNTPIEKLQYRQLANGTNTRYVNGQITDYSLNLPLGVYVLESVSPLSSVTPSAINGSGIFTNDSHYRLAGSFGYDFNSNLSDESKTNDMPKAYLWDYNYTYPVAEVQNATSLQIAYTSFETDNKGNFSFSGTPQADATSPTGKRDYDLGTGSITGTINPVKTYILSYWRNNTGGASYSVTGSSSVQHGITHNGWTNYRHEVSGVSSVVISGSGLIDEVRLYPKGSLISTVTYDPLIGKTSDNNANNLIGYYDYDVAARLTNIKDADRNIVKNFKYNYNAAATALTGSDQTLFYNAAAQGSFTNACTNGGTGIASIYKVPYGRYAATTQIAADAKATTDIAANGQAYADAHGTCYFYNVYYHKRFFRNNCTTNAGIGDPYWYEVPERKFHALNQIDADALAAADADANGQAAANMYANCYCSAEGQAIIAGNCETGVRYYTSSIHVGDHWVCVYHYRFSDGSHSIDYTGNFSSTCSIIAEP